MIAKLRTFFRHKILPHLIAYSAKIAMKALLATCRIRITSIEHINAVATSSPCIIMLWHSKLILIAEILNKYAPKYIYTAFVSKSRDGAALALLAESYPNGRALRVPHNARHQALSQMIHNLKEQREIMLITPDGPRGPRCVMKPGIVLAAREAKAKIIPFSWEASRYWQLKTWDLMRIPKPFSTIEVVFGQPITLTGEESIESDMEYLTSCLK